MKVWGAALVAVREDSAVGALGIHVVDRGQGDEWGVGRWYADYRDLLADRQVEAVDVATPNNTHREIALAALGAGKT